jgi:hypothetical protein
MSTHKLEVTAVKVEQEIDTPQKIMDYLWPSSSRMLIMENEHQPFVFYFHDQQMHMVNVADFFVNTQGKDQVSQIMHQIAALPQVDAIAFVSEGWMRQFEEGSDADDEIEKANRDGLAGDPNRIECLQMTVETRKVPGSYTRMAEIVRSENGSIRELTNEHDLGSGSQGRFSGLFPRGQA